jgi:hypothetical protein
VTVSFRATPPGLAFRDSRGGVYMFGQKMFLAKLGDIKRAARLRSNVPRADRRVETRDARALCYGFADSVTYPVSAPQL